MSTRREREQITALAHKAWGDVVEILTERGETWPETDVTTWGPGLSIAMERARTLAEASTIIGGPNLYQITEQHQA